MFRPLTLRHYAALCAALGTGLAARTAHADAPTQVDVSACGAQPGVEAFRAALSIELSALDAALITSAEAPDNGPRRLRITRCVLDEGQLQLSLFTRNAAHGEQRTLDLRDVPEPARARVAAIALAEMVRAWPPPSTAPAEHTIPSPSPVVAAQPERPAPGRRNTTLAIAARAVAVGTEPTLLYGADLAFDQRVGTWLRAGVMASYLRSSFDGVIGTATLNAFGGDASVSVPLNKAGTAELGPFVSGAYLRATGRSALNIAEETDTAWVIGAGLRAQLHSALSTRLGLLSSLAAGHTLRGAVFRAGNEAGFGYQGVLVEVRVGFAFAP